MATGTDPIVGNWYEDLDNGQQFEVLEINEDRRTIEIQYHNGDIDELDLSDWYDMDLEAVEGSEEWAGPAEGVEENEREYAEADIEEKGWGSRPIRSRRSWDEGEDEEEEEEYDEWDEVYSERWDRDD